MALAIVDGAAARDPPAALAEELADEFGTGAMRTAAPEEDTGCAAVTGPIARAGRELAEFVVRAGPLRISPPLPRASPRSPASTSSKGANLRALISFSSPSSK